MMKAIMRFADKKPVECKEVPKPQPLPGTVIVKIMASAVNYIDFFIAMGLFPLPFPPNVQELCCGLSCSGKIEQVGDGVSKDLIGKKVACNVFADADPSKAFGSWCQYGRFSAQSVNILDDSVSYEDACGDSFSPLGILAKIEELNCKSVVISAAASQTGKQVIKEGMKRGIEVIAIVRKKRQEDMLKAIGAKHIINSTDPKFKLFLKAKCSELNCKLAFDAVGGEFTEQLIQGMLPGSQIYVYGVVGGNMKNLSPMSLAMNNVSIKGFMIEQQPAMKDPQYKRKLLDLIAEDLKTTKCLKTDVAAIFTLDKISDALMNFDKFGGYGKAILVPNYEPQ